MKYYRRFALVLIFVFLSKISFAGTLVQFHIFVSAYEYIGDLDVELYDNDKPITVNNFLRLTEANAYYHGFFHRLVPGFVLQGGGFSAVDVLSTNIITPPYSDLAFVPSFGNIPDEISVGPFHSNAYGTIAMAKSGSPGTANSQFFFNLANNVFLDSTSSSNAGGYTVFGQVLRGTNILNFFNGFRLNAGIVNLTNIYGSSNLLSTVFTTLPDSPTVSNAPPDYDLVYYTISVLNPQMTLQTNGARQISWNTISGLTNNVEYATNLPPVWQVLTNLIGNGAPTNVPDASTNDLRRFYRIHVLY